MHSQFDSETVRSPVGLPGFDDFEGILPSPFLCSNFSRSSSLFPCWFPQLAHCVTGLLLSVSPPSTGMGTFLAEGAALFAGKSGVRAFSSCGFLLNTKLHFQQYITAIVQVGLQRIFWGQHPSPDPQLLPGLLWGKCTAGWGGCWITCLCSWEQLWPSGE